MTVSLPIVFEDTDILILNKPAGITVNRSETTKGDTVQDWSEAYLKITPRSYTPKAVLSEDGIPDYASLDPEEVFSSRGGVVHRLDKETSGILLLAKNAESFTALQKQFKERIVSKTYVALVHGRVIPESGEIKAPVGRLPWNRKQFGIVAGGRESVTKYKTLASGKLPASLKLQRDEKMAKGNYEEATFLELYPETGRTHQIRVHLKFIGHPIFADFLYAGRKTSREDRKHVDRVFLHAQSLSFIHPRAGEKLSFSAPLPEALHAFLLKLEKVE